MFVGFNYENTKTLYFAKYEFRANLRYVSANKNDPIIYQAFSNHCIDLMKASKSIVVTYCESDDFLTIYYADSLRVLERIKVQDVASGQVGIGQSGFDVIATSK